MGGLPTGTYRVFFNSFNYAAQWYNGKPDIDSADAVSVTVGQTVNAIDAQLEPLLLDLGPGNRREQCAAGWLSC